MRNLNKQREYQDILILPQKTQHLYYVIFVLYL